MDSDSDLAAATAARSVQVLTAVSMLAENLVRARQYSTYGRADQDAAAARSQRAQRLAEHGAARVAYGSTGDRRWARTATVVDAARAWGAAHDWADRDPAARIAQHRAEALLRKRSPAAMEQYDTLRAQGADALTAMQEAAPLFLAPTLPAALTADEAARAEAGTDYARADALRATSDIVITPADEASIAVQYAARHTGAAEHAVHGGIHAAAPAVAAHAYPSAETTADLGRQGSTAAPPPARPPARPTLSGREQRWQHAGRRAR